WRPRVGRTACGSFLLGSSSVRARVFLDVRCGGGQGSPPAPRWSSWLRPATMAHTKVYLLGVELSPFERGRANLVSNDVYGGACTRALSEALIVCGVAVQPIEPPPLA
ncbi:unnamed protein product, partial [Ectocarpus sp. 6 AP-2014]